MSHVCTTCIAALHAPTAHDDITFAYLQMSLHLRPIISSSTTLMRNKKTFGTIIIQHFTSYVVNINSDTQSTARCQKSITVHFSWRVWGPLENGAKFAHILGNEVLGLALHVAVDFEILHVATVLQLLLQDNVGQLYNTTTKAWHSRQWKDYNGDPFIGDWIS